MGADDYFSGTDEIAANVGKPKSEPKPKVVTDPATSSILKHIKVTKGANYTLDPNDRLRD